MEKNGRRADKRSASVNVLVIKVDALRFSTLRLQICSPDANPGQTSPQARPSPDCAALQPGYLASKSIVATEGTKFTEVELGANEIAPPFKNTSLRPRCSLWL